MGSLFPSPNYQRGSFFLSGLVVEALGKGETSVLFAFAVYHLLEQNRHGAGRLLAEQKP